MIPANRRVAVRHWITVTDLTNDYTVPNGGQFCILKNYGAETDFTLIQKGDNTADVEWPNVGTGEVTEQGQYTGIKAKPGATINVRIGIV